MGKEPIWHDGRVVSYVTSAAYGYSIGQGIVYGYLPTALACTRHRRRGRVLRPTVSPPP